MKRSEITSIAGNGDERILELCQIFWHNEDIIEIEKSKLGSGSIGGKSTGRMLGESILRQVAPELYYKYIMPMKSWFLGTDCFEDFLMLNEITKDPTPDKILQGELPGYVKEFLREIVARTDHYPLIIRSSANEEDQFGNAMAGRFESIFCTNQGDVSMRLEQVSNAVKGVYASLYCPQALDNMGNKQLKDDTIKMGILIQKVVGRRHGELFFPDISGVGNSQNIYIWDKKMKPEAGIIRIVIGLGTRAVRRGDCDYARLVTLDDPCKPMPVEHGKEEKFTQKKAEVLLLSENRVNELEVKNLQEKGYLATPELFFSNVYKEGLFSSQSILDYDGLLRETEFPQVIKRIMEIISKAYQYPIDIEFAVNFVCKDTFHISLLQCRPLRTKGTGEYLMTAEPSAEEIVFATIGNFMGGNYSLMLDNIIYINPLEYLQLDQSSKYEVARMIGRLNRTLKGKQIMLIGPGRFGTTTPSLGVPVHFAEVSHMTVLCEVSYNLYQFTPELSFGTHFFQDLVESGTFYAAIFQGREGTHFYPERLLAKVNIIEQLLGKNSFEDVIHVVDAGGIMLHSDVISQRLRCFELRHYEVLGNYVQRLSNIFSD